MEKHTINRDGRPPLKFSGEQIASATNQSYSTNRWTIIHIFKTKGGRYVANIGRRTQWEGERDSDVAEVFDTPGLVIDWLKEGEDTLGPVGQEAVEEAVKNDPAFAEVWVETVE